MASPPYPGFYPSYETCSQVTAYCPVKATTLGYFPNKGVNVFLAIGYGFAALMTIVTGIWKRTWGFSIAVAAGCALECVGMFFFIPELVGNWNPGLIKFSIVSQNRVRRPSIISG